MFGFIEGLTYGQPSITIIESLKRVVWRLQEFKRRSWKLRRAMAAK